MIKVLSGLIQAILRIPFWVAIGVIAISSELVYIATTTKRERRIDMMLEDIRIAGFRNPAAGHWLGEQYLKKLAEDDR